MHQVPFIAAGVAGLALVVGAPACAQNYPVKPVRIVVPFAPGGGNDLLGRLYAARMSEAFGQTVYVDNRVGAGGNIGAELTAKSPADGYTIMLASSSMAVSVSFYPRLNYSATQDLTGLALVGSAPLLLVAHPSVPIKSVKDLVALSKKRKGGLDFGSNGSGSVSHLSGVLLNDVAKIDITHIPYKSAGAVSSALLGGEVDLGFPSVVSAKPFVQAGKLRALAVTTAKPSSAMPEVPTLASYFPGFDTDAWWGFFAPAGTPPAVVDRLNAEIRKAHGSAEMRAALQREGAEAVWLGPDEFPAFFRREIEKYARLIKLSGAKPE
jgi:tripartite-type tricarboxylate transporter receptor subunit TctC